MEITLASPRGFCAGVDRAIDIVERAITLFGAPIYVRHEVVHNKFVVGGLRDKGAIFVDELDDVPDNNTVIFSAHGVSLAVQEEAKSRDLQVFDATCPLVTKVHMEVAKYSQEDKEVVFIGHAGHPEVEGTMGQYQQKTNGKGRMYLVESPQDVMNMDVVDENNLAFVTQTTLSVDDTAQVIEALNKRFPSIVGPRKDDICYATQNRQDAVKELTEFCDILFIVGSQNSSNSNRLREIADLKNIDAYLIDDVEDIDPAWLEGKQHVGLSAGASAPEVLVQGVLNYLKGIHSGVMSSKTIYKEEKVEFVLPKALR